MSPKSHTLFHLIPISLAITTAAQAQTEDPELSPAEAPTADPEIDDSETVAPEADDGEAELAPEGEAEPPLAVEPVPEPELAEEPPLADPAPELTEAEPAAPSLLPLKVGTHTFSRFEFRKEYDQAGVSRARFQEGDRTVYRARLTFQTNPLELTDGITGHVYFAPQASGTWGTVGVDGTIGEAALGIYEGYFMLKGKVLEGKVGRFAMNYGEAGTIGNLDWHEAGRAFDGAHFRVKAGKANVDLFLTQQAEGWPVINQDFLGGDAYFWGAYAELGPAIVEGLGLDVFALGKSAAATDITDATTGTVTHKDGATFMTFGGRAKQKISVFDYRVEGGVQVGKAVGPATAAVDRVAYQVNGDLGVAPIKQLHLAVGGAVASGDDATTTDVNEAYDELYPTTHKWLGLMDVIGFRTNILSGNADVEAMITPSTTFKVTGHVFARMEENGLGRSPDATSDFAGYEIDTQVMQKIGGPFLLRGLYGIFIPNQDHYGTDVPIHYTEVEAGLRF